METTQTNFKKMCPVKVDLFQFLKKIYEDFQFVREF